MSEGQRPGGLTALAVINFVLAGLGLMNLAGALVMSQQLEESRRQGEKIPRFVEIMLSMTWVDYALALGMWTLMVLSGIGYLKQRRFLGRTLGNLFVLVGLGLAVRTMATDRFMFMSLIDLVYPLLTAILINGAFREDLVN
jgi:hypothetical protein